MSHLIKSYEKHYINNKPLDKITSLAEESALSVTLQTQKSDRPQEGPDKDYINQNDHYFFKFPDRSEKDRLINKKRGSNIHNLTE